MRARPARPFVTTALDSASKPTSSGLPAAGRAVRGPVAPRSPAVDARLAFWPVSARVGRVKEDNAGLIERDLLAVAPPELDDPPPALA